MNNILLTTWKKNELVKIMTVDDFTKYLLSSLEKIIKIQINEQTKKQKKMTLWPERENH